MQGVFKYAENHTFISRQKNHPQNSMFMPLLCQIWHGIKNIKKIHARQKNRGLSVNMASIYLRALEGLIRQMQPHLT
jgi:hypothetical protein